MKSTGNECKTLEDTCVLLHDEKWPSVEEGTLEDALDAFLPSRNIPYKAQLAARSKELDQTLDLIFTRSKEAFSKDVKYAKKPAVKKPPLEDIVPTVPNVGYERNVALGLEKDADGKIRAGLRVVYEKSGCKKQFLLPLSECSNIAPQIIKTAEATAAFLTEKTYNVYDGAKNRGDVYGLKFLMNEIGEIIMSLVLFTDDLSFEDVLKEVDGKGGGAQANAKAKADAAANGVEDSVAFFVPGSLRRNTFDLKNAGNSHVKKSLEKYAPALRGFVEENRGRLALVGAFITWHDAGKSAADQKTTARPWFRVTGYHSVRETVSPAKISIFPHMENLHPPRTQSIPVVMKTLADGLSLQKDSSSVLLISEYYMLPHLISHKCKRTAALGEMLKSLTYSMRRKSSRGNSLMFYSYEKNDGGEPVFPYTSQTPDAVIQWGQFKSAEPFKHILELPRQKQARKIAWVIDTREDNPGAKCTNADLLERNHTILYPYYTLQRVVGIDVGPQKGEPLALVAFYERYDGEIKMNPKQVTAKEEVPQIKMKAGTQQVSAAHKAKEKVPDRQGSGGEKRRAGDRHERNGVGRSGVQNQTRKRGSGNPERPSGDKRPRRGGWSSSFDARPMGRGGPSMNPWGDYPSNRPMAEPDQSTSEVLCQLTNVIGQQLLLAEMNNAAQFASSSSMGEMEPDRGDAGDYDGAWPPQENDDFPPPPPPPRQLPTTLPSSRSRDIPPLLPRENYRSTDREDIRRPDLPTASRESVARDSFRGTGRQDLSGAGFWSTPLKDLNRGEFRSVSPRPDDFRDASASREAARRTTCREDSPRDYYANTKREGFFGASSIREEVRSGSPDREDYSYRDSRDDSSRGVFGIAARESLIQDIPRSAAGENSTREGARRSRWDASANSELTSTSWGDSRLASVDDINGRGFRSTALDREAWRPSRNDFTRERSPLRDETTSSSVGRRDWDLTVGDAPRDSRGTLHGSFARVDSRENFTRDESRTTARDYSRRDSRLTRWGESTVREDAYNNSTRTALDDFRRPPAEDYTNAARENVTHPTYSPHVEHREAPQEDLSRDVFFGTRNAFGISSRDTFDTARSTREARDSGFSSGHYSEGGIRSSTRYSGDRDVWAGGITRRN